MKGTLKNSRIICGKTIEKLTSDYPNLVHITSDGNDYTRKNRSRHFDVGIAEGNLIGIAAGFALKNMPVIVNGISSFIIPSAFLQIRNNICFPNLKVIMIGIGSGVSYGSLGYTHQSFEDIGLLLNLPNIKIYLPADAVQARRAIINAVSRSGPSYIRLRTGNEPVYYSNHKTKQISFDEPTTIKKGGDLIIFTYGTHVIRSAELHNRLRSKGIKAMVININSMNIYPRKLLLNTINHHRAIFTIEEHYLDTGLGSLMSNLLTDFQINIPLFKIGLPKEFCHIAGSSEELLRHYHLDIDSIENFILDKYLLVKNQT